MKISILNSILEDREFSELSRELASIEEALENCRQQLLVLEEGPMDFADRYDNEWELFDEVSRRVQIAKKAMGLANRLSKPEDRMKHQRIVIKILNQLRGLMTKLTNKLTREVQQGSAA